jgi:integrase/recombinase XerD
MAILGIRKKRTVEAMAARGEIPSAAKIGRRWTLNLSALRTFVTESGARHMATKRKAPQGCIWHKESLWGAAMVNGVRVRWPLHTDNPKIARQRREATVDAAIARKFEKLGIGHRLKAPEHGAKTYTDALEALPHYFADRAVEGSTQGRYFCSLAQIDEHLSGKRLSDITGELIAEIVKARRAQGVTSATIKRDLVALSAVMNAAVAEGWIDANPVLPRLKNIKEKRGPIVLPERAHIDLVIARASGMVADIIEAAVRTGAREDELIKLRRSDIDHDRRQMTLWRRGDGGPKGGKTRVVDLVPFDGYAHLRSLPAFAKSDLVFWHGDGEDYKNFASNFAAVVRRTATWAKTSGVAFRPFRFHDLRHYHAVEFLKSGRDIYDLQKRLGHSSVKVTEMYLAYLTAEEERVAKFGKAAGGTK